MTALGYRAEIDAGQRFLESIEPDENIALPFHGHPPRRTGGALPPGEFQELLKRLGFPDGAAGVIAQRTQKHRKARNTQKKAPIRNPGGQES